MARSPGMMTTHTQSWAAVEEKLQMDIAIWKSGTAPQSRPKEYRELVDGAFIQLIDRGMAIISIGNLEWELTPPSVYMGYCEKQADDWLLVSDSEFRVALRSPHRRGVLHVCPCSQDMSSDQYFVGVDAELGDMLTRFFSSEETGTSATPTLRRTMSQKKRAEIIGKNFGPPFVRCVNDLQNATDISDVLDILLGFCAVYVSNQQVLQQVPEESDFEDCYFYDKEDVEEQLRLFNAKIRNASLWVRQQVRDAAMKCQVAAEATSEIAKLGVEMLLDIQSESFLYDGTFRGRYASDYLRVSQIYQKGKGEEIHNPVMVDNVSNSETNELIKLNSNFSSGLHIGNVPRQDNAESGAVNASGSSLDTYLNESGEYGNDPLSAFSRTPSFGSGLQSDMGNDTFSETSWDLVHAQTKDLTNAEDEDDVLGAGITDAESLDMMLRDRDPCGSSDCSNLINEFLNLNLSSVSSTDQEQNVDGQETPKSSVLKRLASWSSSNSGWSDRDVPSSGPSMSTKIGTVQLETLAEEPACDPETARLCLANIGRAAAKGDVLQWCSCKFNKFRNSIELRFQVGSFMEDDIATLSTGIVRGSPLRIEIFLDSTNMRQNLLEGNVRISVDQGGSTKVTPPVVGLSCYIPHLVRQYLKHHIRELSNSGYEFSNGELLTGLMKHVVAKLVFIKHSCCVCDDEAYPDPIISFIPGPCEQNLCQALHEAWLVVAPKMVLETSTLEYWLRTCFKQGNVLDEDRMLYYMEHPLDEWVRTSNYLYKLSLVVKYLRKKTVQGSWLKLVNHVRMKTDKELNYRARLLAIERENIGPETAEETPRGSPSSTGLHPYETGYISPDTY